jgi:hypothetical protein
MMYNFVKLVEESRELTGACSAISGHEAIRILVIFLRRRVQVNSHPPLLLSPFLPQHHHQDSVTDHLSLRILIFSSDSLEHSLLTVTSEPNPITDVTQGFGHFYSAPLYLTFGGSFSPHNYRLILAHRDK